MLIGLGKMIKKVTSSLTLLATRIIGFSNTGSGGGSYYTTMVETTGPGFASKL